MAEKAKESGMQRLWWQSRSWFPSVSHRTDSSNKTLARPIEETSDSSSLASSGTSLESFFQRSGPVWAVWACWVLMTVLLLGLIHLHTINMPYMDEYSLLPVLSHTEPMTLRWLWSQHNEHRIPLPRLIQLGLAVLTDGDFRAGTYLTALLMSRHRNFVGRHLMQMPSFRWCS
jgi:hypothetical protein